jgi:hypothetical protein
MTGIIDNDGARRQADQALAVPVEPVARLDPTGFDPSRWRDVSRELPPNCVSVLVIWQWHKANKSAGALSHQVLWFDLGTWFDAYGEPQDAPTHWMPLPVAPLHAIAMEARQGGDGETRLRPKDDSAGPQDIAHD